MASATTTPTSRSTGRERIPVADLSALSESLGRMMLDSAERFQGTALEFRRGAETVAISYPQLGAIAAEIARGLIALGIERGDRVAILGATSAQWTLADYGSLCAGAIVTPIYYTNSPEECAYVLKHSGTRLVFCENPEQAEKIAPIRGECPALDHVVLFEGLREGAITLEQLRELAAEATERSLQLRLSSVHPDDLATLVYTSGTTGPPKGCMLSHGNLLAASQAYVQELGIDDTHTLYQFLPLAHVLARVAQAVVIRAGARACFWSGDPARIVDELSDLQPSHFPAVPRIFEKIHGAVIGKAQDGPAPTRLLFRWALRSGARARAALREGRRPGLATSLQYRVADRIVLSKVRSVFGPAHQIALVGAAPVARELLEFFDACGVLVLEGYGLTESCAAATLNTPRAVRFGTVGRPLPGTEVAIAADGEILIRGPHVFHGYYKDLAATGDAVTADGWLCSGDLGSITDDGFVAITGRKKDLIITSSGKNITPVNVESLLRDRRYITEAVVFGDNRPYLVALLTLDRDESRKLAERVGIAADGAAIARSPAIRAEVQREVDEVNAKLARIEQVKRFAILEHDLTQAGGELTPTLKVKRAVVYDKYADVFAGLYGEGVQL
jgi:long-chain acyl-CoA synthetase